MGQSPLDGRGRPQVRHWWRRLGKPPGSGGVHSAQRGSVRVPLWGASSRPHPPHLIRLAAQLRQRGRPVSSDREHSAVRPHNVHTSADGIRQETHRGPSAVRVFTGRRLPHLMHLSVFAGSLLRHELQTGRPCRSRAPTWRTRPHRAQAVTRIW